MNQIECHGDIFKKNKDKKLIYNDINEEKKSIFQFSNFIEGPGTRVTL